MMQFLHVRVLLRRIPPQSLLAACCDYRHCHERRPVRFTGFGTFKSRKKPAHAGHNSVTGATIDIPASTVPVFRAGKAFKDTEEATESRAYRTEVLQAPLLRIK